MRALVLEEKNHIQLRDIEITEELGPNDVRISVRTVGICGSDIHFYRHGKIGPFVLTEPMVLGHEASGKVIEVGSNVTNLKPGDRVCMEPGIPPEGSRALREGIYNLDPHCTFWATPPTHGSLRYELVHPAAFTYKLPDNVTYEEGALVEPLSVGMHAVTKAKIVPGDVAVVIGAGPIGIVTALCALAGGCSRIIISDVQQPKLDRAATMGPITPVNTSKEDLQKVVDEVTGNWGADIVFECSGHAKEAGQAFKYLRPNGVLVHVGIPMEPVTHEVIDAMVKEARIEHVFRYAHVWPRVLSLMETGRLNATSLITDRFDFEQAVDAFDFASDMPPTSVKVQINLPGD